MGSRASPKSCVTRSTNGSLGRPVPPSDSITARAESAGAPTLIYQEAELPLRVTRDLFTGDFEKAYVDNDQAYKRITGYLKKTSPHLVKRVQMHRERTPLFDHFGLQDRIDVAIKRWQSFSRKDAIHADSGLTFDELASKRNATVPGLAIPDER